MARTSRKWRPTLNLLAVLPPSPQLSQTLQSISVSEVSKIGARANAAGRFRGILWSVQAHIILGLLLVVACSILLGLALAARRKGLTVATACGLAVVLLYLCLSLI